MASGHKHNHHPSTTKKEASLFIPPSQFENPKIPTTTNIDEERNPNLIPNNSNPNFDTTHIMEQGADVNANANANANADVNVPLTIDGIEEDEALGGSEYLTREELVRRRFRRTKQIEKLYRDHYWGLMEEVRVKYRDYYWKYGMSPFKEDEEVENAAAAAAAGNGDVEGSGENNNNNNNNNNNICSSSNRLGYWENCNIDLKHKKCSFPGCKSKAMALTNYCHPHILMDPKQKLYKPCTYVIKSVPTGPVHCGKPILTATVPSLCTVHFQKAQTHVTRALRKAGLNVTSSSKLAPKFHLIVAESVRQINAQRRERKANMSKSVVKEENAA